MPAHRTRRAVAALAAAVTAAAGAIALAAPAEAFTQRIETNLSAANGALEVVTLAAPVRVAQGSTLRVARRAPYDFFYGGMTLTAEGAEPIGVDPEAVPGTTTAWNARLAGVPQGTYRAVLRAGSWGGQEDANYEFTLVVGAGTRATVRVPLTGSVVRYTMAGWATEWVLGGSRITYVAPPGVSFRNATVRAGQAEDAGGPQVVERATPDDLRVTKVPSGSSLRLRIPTSTAPGRPVRTRTPFIVELGIGTGRTSHGTGRLVIQSRLYVDPAGTPWSAPPGVGDRRTDYIGTGTALRRHDELRSANGRYRLVMQKNSNLVLWRGDKVVWQTGRRGAVWTELNNDGNLIQRDAAGTVVWQTGSHGARGHADLWLRDDGGLQIHTPQLQVLWSSGTGVR